MDEHYFPNSSYDSLCCVILMNFVTGEIIDVLPSRKKIIVTKYFSDIKASTQNLITLKSELDNVKYIYRSFLRFFYKILYEYVCGRWTQSKMSR